jgi:hypothetical protein
MGFLLPISDSNAQYVSGIWKYSLLWPHCSEIPAKLYSKATSQVWGAVRGAFRFRPSVRGAVARW